MHDQIFISEKDLEIKEQVQKTVNRNDAMAAECWKITCDVEGLARNALACWQKDKGILARHFPRFFYKGTDR